MSPPDASAVELAYEPAPPIRRRRLVRGIVRGIILALVLLALIALAWRPVTGMWWQWQVRSSVAQSRAFTFPEGTVIYEEDLSAIGALRGKPGYREAAARGGARPVAVREDPPLLARLARITERGAGVFSLFGSSAAPSRPLAFLHERTSEKGVTRIVALRITGVTYSRVDGGSLTVNYYAMPLEPRDKQPPLAEGIGEGRAPDLNLLPPSAMLRPDGPDDPGPIRIFAARPDPTDAAAFLLPYEIAGRKDEILFRLVDDAMGRGAFVIPVNQPRPHRPATPPEP